jgi:glycosyltransferase involved in cell wall biosynthesis
VLAQAVNEYGGKSFILPDLLPNVEPRNALKKMSYEATIITLICTYAPDEPYQEVFMAMKSLGSEYQLCVTGKIPSNLQQNSIPNNIKLLGYLSHDDYWDQLYKSHIIIDLSTMENCLVCGAYEAMAIEKPLILSLNPASVDLFGDFAVHTTNDAKSIALAIRKISNDYTLFTEKLSLSKIDFLAQEKERLDIFRQALNDRIEN